MRHPRSDDFDSISLRNSAIIYYTNRNCRPGRSCFNSALHILRRDDDRTFNAGTFSIINQSFVKSTFRSNSIV